ncbi:hypothetical protein D3C79_1067590 [compost metagenome]
MVFFRGDYARHVVLYIMVVVAVLQTCEKFPETIFNLAINHRSAGDQSVRLLADPR